MVITVLVHDDFLLPILVVFIQTGSVLVAQNSLGSPDEVGCGGGVEGDVGAYGGPRSLCPGPLLQGPEALPGDEGLRAGGTNTAILIFFSGDPSEPSRPCFPNLKGSFCLTNVPDSFPLSS